MIEKRASGILLHLISLPSPSGIGDLGPEAYRFVDFLVEAGQKYWQILPLNPTGPNFTNSPYNSESAFAGNPLFINLDALVKEGLLTPNDFPESPSFPAGRIDYSAVAKFKLPLLKLAFSRFQAQEKPADFLQFCEQHSSWLDDYALFSALGRHFPHLSWQCWPLELRDRHPQALAQAYQELLSEIELEKFLQYLFFKEWFSLKSYANAKGIKIIGDVAIYLDYHSVEVWKNPHLFKLDREKKPLAVSGVPPDYFSATGQLWGHPVYRWEECRKSGYQFWIQRLKHNFELYDLVRIDHFRGFQAYWEVPAGEANAINGRWVPGPGADFFETLLDHFSTLPLIAEDLGVITPEVIELRQKFNLPGIKVLLFAFGEDYPHGPYLPPNQEENSLVYTGTHDNNTVRGWFEHEATEKEKSNLFHYLGRPVTADEVAGEFVKMAMNSPARLAIIPVQDLLSLGAEARLNRPASPNQENYRWRLTQSQISPQLAAQLRELTQKAGRI